MKTEERVVELVLLMGACDSLEDFCLLHDLANGLISDPWCDVNEPSALLNAILLAARSTKSRLDAGVPCEFFAMDRRGGIPYRVRPIKYGRSGVEVPFLYECGHLRWFFCDPEHIRSVIPVVQRCGKRGCPDCEDSWLREPK